MSEGSLHDIIEMPTNKSLCHMIRFRFSAGRTCVTSLDVFLEVSLCRGISLAIDDIEADLPLGPSCASFGLSSASDVILALWTIFPGLPRHEAFYRTRETYPIL